MLIYTTLGIAVLCFLVLTFLNSKVFGVQPDVSQFEDLPNFKGGCFQNQSATPVMAKDGSYWKIIQEMRNRPKDVHPLDPLPVIKTDLKALAIQTNSIVWFGHSSYLLTIDGKRILVDPVFNNASPIKLFGKPYKMTNEYQANDFPEIDVLVITHDHYDHLDYQTVCDLKPKVKMVITAKGVDEHLKLWGYNPELIIALNWDENALTAGFEFTCLAARHFSGRKFKRGQTLWGSFAIKSPSATIYLGGDSGYDTHFKEIGEKYGPFDLAILECGQYGKYWPLIHMTPEETLQASKDLKADALLPVHWGKFSLANHSWTAPVERLIAANADQAQTIFTPQIGAVLKFEAENTSKKWWNQLPNGKTPCSTDKT